MTGRDRRIVIAGSVHPEYRQIVATYLANLEPEIVTVPVEEGRVDPSRIAGAVDDQTAALVVQQPNFFGQLEAIDAMAAAAREKGALTIVSVDPISLGSASTPRQLRCRHRGRRGSEPGQSAFLRRSLPRDHGLPRRVRPQASRPDRRSNRRPERQALLGPDLADSRAAHSPREGDVEHLHQPGPAGLAGEHLSRGPGTRGPAPGGRALDAEGPLRGRAARTGPGPVARVPGTVLQGVRGPFGPRPA